MGSGGTEGLDSEELGQERLEGCRESAPEGRAPIRELSRAARFQKSKKDMGKQYCHHLPIGQIPHMNGMW